MLRGCNSESNCLGRSPGTDPSARRDRCQCPAGPICLIPSPGWSYISVVCFWLPVCLCFVFIPGQYFFLAVGSLLCQADVVLWSQWCFFGRWLELFSSHGVVFSLFLSNCLLESIQNMLPDSKYFPGDTVFFPRHLPVQALFAPPPTVLHPVVITGCWAGPRFRPTVRSAWPVTRTEAGVLEGSPFVIWCQDSAVVCGSASRLRVELVAFWTWAICRLQ